MTFWTAAVLIVLICAIASVFRKPRRDLDSAEGVPSQRETELQRELTELRERVRVLERIATDDTQGRRLSDQIERLRED
ncbi:hypothetical protein PK98_02530 [Croceibacterium mercuriale]|uniref:Uncharacterized protein n=1 Tax=Croceibacterium mercuriale TaxID=1572751 RepID=A0A0B2C085_9SPHN|nr:hypothetical protein [Croceibacterium mercuriale]KHL25565.1 hypothetical protein PK98_02530 [Croceibacterium mercuriale]